MINARATVTLVSVVAVLSSCTNPSDRGEGAAEPSPTPSAQPSVTQLVTQRIEMPGQPGKLLYKNGSLWIGGGVFVARLEEDRIVQRFPTRLSRYGIDVHRDRLWATGGGDGGAPDGSVVSFDVRTGERVERIQLPQRSPYGVDARSDAIYVALFQGTLLRLDRDGNTIGSAPLSYGLTEVLVAHGRVWVSSPQRGKVWWVEFNTRDDTSAAATDFRSEPKQSCPQGLESTTAAIWVADPCARKVRLLDPETGEQLDVLEDVGRRPIDIDIADGFAWIVSFNDDLVSVVDLETLEVVAQGRGGRRSVAIAAHGREAWVANHEGYSLTHLTFP